MLVLLSGHPADPENRLQRLTWVNTLSPGKHRGRVGSELSAVVSEMRMDDFFGM